jgi:hypothetical protein
MIKMSAWNARGLNPTKRQILYSWMQENRVSICAVSEVFGLSSEHRLTVDKKLSGYRIVARLHRSRTKGVAFVVDPRLSIEVIPQFSYHSDISAAVTLKLIELNLTIMSVYIPNGSRLAGFMELQEHIEQKLLDHPRLIIIGDMNARLPHLDNRPNGCGRQLQRFLNEQLGSIERCAPTPDVFTFTPSRTILDHCLVSAAALPSVQSLSVVSEDEFKFESDHRALLLTLSGASLPRCTARRVRWTRLRKALERDLEPWYDSLPIQPQVTSFLNLVQQLELKYSKEVEVGDPSDYRPYMDEELQRLLRKRRRSNADNKKFKKALRKAVTDSWVTFCSDSSKSPWRRLKVVREQRAPPIPSSQLETASRSLERSFHIRDDLQPDTQTPNNIFNVDPGLWTGFTQGQVNEVLKALPTSGSRGPDDLSYLLIRRPLPKLLAWITGLFNASLRLGQLPSLWMTANIIPLPKPQGGVRPIALLSNLLKALERLLLPQIRAACKLPSFQFCDREKGTSKAIKALTEYINQAQEADQKRFTYVVFFDVKKAFDRVHIPSLLKDLQSVEGLNPCILQWLGRYLLSRNAMVGPHHIDIENGVPQGSVLGPYLFQWYTRKILDNLLDEIYRAAYADDMVIAYSHPSLNVVQAKLQDSLNRIHDQCCKLGVELDSVKTKAMFIRKSRTNIGKPKRISLRLGPTALEYVLEYKYLGLLFDSSLSFKNAIKKKISNGRKRNAELFRTNPMSTKELVQLWKGYVRSYINYGLFEIKQYLSQTLMKKLLTFYNVSMRKLAGALPMDDADLAARRINMPTSSEWLLKEPGGHLDVASTLLKPGKHVRSKEITLFRWRSGRLWINSYKHHLGILAHNTCRFCDRHPETREHLLLSCQAPTVRTARIPYEAALLDLFPDGFTDLTVNDLVGTHSTHKDSVSRLAAALFDFTRAIHVWG